MKSKENTVIPIVFGVRLKTKPGRVKFYVAVGHILDFSYNDLIEHTGSVVKEIQNVAKSYFGKSIKIAFVINNRVVYIN